MYIANTNTYLFIAIFAVVYMAFIARKTARRQLDLYDLVMLSTVAIIPSVFVAFPRLADWLSGIAGVPVIFLIALIPVSFAGWGLREVGAVWLFGMVGIAKESALAMSVCFGLLLVLAGLPGLMLFLHRSLTRRVDII